MQDPLYIIVFSIFKTAQPFTLFTGQEMQMSVNVDVSDSAHWR